MSFTTVSLFERPCFSYIPKFEDPKLLFDYKIEAGARFNQFFDDEVHITPHGLNLAQGTVDKLKLVQDRGNEL